MRFQEITMMSGVTTGTSTVVVPIHEFDRISFSVVFGSGAGAGTVVLESARTANYSGTWQTLSTIAWVAATRQHYDAIDVCGQFVRARWTADVTGGTADVYLECKTLGNY